MLRRRCIKHLLLLPPFKSGRFSLSPLRNLFPHPPFFARHFICSPNNRRWRCNKMYLPSFLPLWAKLKRVFLLPIRVTSSYCGSVVVFVATFKTQVRKGINFLPLFLLLPPRSAHVQTTFLEVGGKSLHEAAVANCVG